MNYGFKEIWKKMIVTQTIFCLPGGTEEEMINIIQDVTLQHHVALCFAFMPSMCNVGLLFTGRLYLLTLQAADSFITTCTPDDDRLAILLLLLLLLLLLWLYSPLLGFGIFFSLSYTQ
jgi:hypothetical protein